MAEERVSVDGGRALAWNGEEPSREVRGALAARDITLHVGDGTRASGDAARCPCVVATKEATAPSHGSDPPWIWLCAAAIPLGAAFEAARRGAYESISRREKG